jgi:SAM-dependent methyltransferase
MEDYNYFKNDSNYSKVLRNRLEKGLEMDSAITLAKHLTKVTGYTESGLNILDIGSGPGHYFSVIDRLNIGKIASYTGIDIDIQNVNFGNDYFKANKRVKFIHSSVFDFQNWNDYDCIISANTLPHVPNISSVLNKIRKAHNTRFLLFRMLIGEECVQIKKHLAKDNFDNLYDVNFQYNNIYSLDFLRTYLGGEWNITVLEDSFDIDRLSSHTIEGKEKDDFYKMRVSRNVDGRIFKGEIHMPWKFVLCERV